MPNKFREIKCWDVATNHLTRDDDKRLHRHCLATHPASTWSSLTVDASEYGYYVYTNKLLDKSNSDFMSNEFIKLYNDAFTAGIDIIRFDSNAVVNSDYPTFNW